jgi:hypothetical protein
VLLQEFSIHYLAFAPIRPIILGMWLEIPINRSQQRNTMIKSRDAALPTTPFVPWCGLLLLGAYLQGGFTKLVAIDGALAEMQHFRLKPPLLAAVATIVLEIERQA